MNEELITNHNMRIVSLTNSERVLCLFGEIKGEDEKVAGYRMVYPYLLTLGELNDDGTILSTILDGVHILLSKIIELVANILLVSFIQTTILSRTMPTD